MNTNKDHLSLSKNLRRKLRSTFPNLRKRSNTIEEPKKVEFQISISLVVRKHQKTKKTRKTRSKNWLTKVRLMLEISTLIDLDQKSVGTLVH